MLGPMDKDSSWQYNLLPRLSHCLDLQHRRKSWSIYHMNDVNIYMEAGDASCRAVQSVEFGIFDK